MNIWAELASKTDILFRLPPKQQESSIVEVDGKFEVIRPLGLPVRVKRGCLHQKRFDTREQAERIKMAWDKTNNSKRWIERENE